MKEQKERLDLVSRAPMCAFRPNQAIEQLILYWFPLLSTSIEEADTILKFILKIQSFRSKCPLISGASFTTRTRTRMTLSIDVVLVLVHCHNIISILKI